MIKWSSSRFLLPRQKGEKNKRIETIWIFIRFGNFFKNLFSFKNLMLLLVKTIFHLFFSVWLWILQRWISRAWQLSQKIPHWWQGSPTPSGGRLGWTFKPSQSCCSLCCLVAGLLIDAGHLITHMDRYWEESSSTEPNLLYPIVFFLHFQEHRTLTTQEGSRHFCTELFQCWNLWFFFF